jgi:D-psicose/D-tagatose/L-ribulose 3-epimerase
MTSLPIGANVWIWESPVDTSAIETHAPRIAEWGFDVVELPLEQPADWNPSQVKPLLDQLGLGAGVCAVMAPGRDLSTNDQETVRRTQDYLRRCIEAAAGVGAPVVGGPLYAATGALGHLSAEERAERIARVAEHLQPVLDEAEKVGVGLAVEPLNRFETPLFNTVEQTQELLAAADHPNLGLLLDTFHMNIEERDPAAAIRVAGDRLFHFHACGNDRGAPGNDTIDWPAIRDALIAIDYRGQVTIESFTSANQTIATAASIWRPLAASQDLLATEGLAFLRMLFTEEPAG